MNYNHRLNLRSQINSLRPAVQYTANCEERLQNDVFYPGRPIAPQYMSHANVVGGGLRAPLPSPQCNAMQCGVSANEYSCAQEPKINFGDLTPHLTHAKVARTPHYVCLSLFRRWQRRRNRDLQTADGSGRTGDGTKTTARTSILTACRCNYR